MSFGPAISPIALELVRMAGAGVTDLEFFNVRDFGALDGQDITQAVQNAYTAIPPEGGVLFYPKIDAFQRPFQIRRSNIWVLGSGPGTHLRALGFTPNLSGMFEVLGPNVKDVIVSSLKVDGQGTDTCRGILVQGGAEASIQGVHLYNWLGELSQRGRGITVLQNPATESPPHKPVRISDCYFFNNQIGVVFHRCLYSITGSTFESNVWDGIYVEGSARGVISDNLITFSKRSGINIVFTERQTVVGNQVEDGGAGITCYEGRGNTIVANRVERCPSAGIDIRTNSLYNVIADNIVNNNPQEGIQLINGSKFNKVHDNVVSRNARNGIYVASEENVLEGNQCFNNGGGGSFAGIQLAGANLCYVRDNRCWDDQPTKTQDYGIMVVGGSDLNRIWENELRGNQVASLLLSGGPNNDARDN